MVTVERNLCDYLCVIKTEGDTRSNIEENYKVHDGTYTRQWNLFIGGNYKEAFANIDNALRGLGIEEIQFDSIKERMASLPDPWPQLRNLMPNAQDEPRGGRTQ